jgi:hypothetical protein
MKKYCLCAFFAYITATNVYAFGIPDVSHIPDPEVQVTLPSGLIGEFTFPYIEENYPRWGWRMEIHENNKYLLHRFEGDIIAKDYGYVIYEGYDYYFLPIDGNMINKKTKITLNENGFSFISYWPIELFTERKHEDNPVIEIDTSCFPDPKVQIVLPLDLIGEFEFPYFKDLVEKYNSNVNWRMEIHENNKYLLHRRARDDYDLDYGYIIQEEGDYYFLPVKVGIIGGKTKITPTDNGFSFYSSNIWYRDFMVERKR